MNDAKAPYDSTTDTLAHIQRVRSILSDCIQNLTERAIRHDASKLEEPEKSAFDAATPRLATSTYGSDEYKAFLADLKPALDHHYANNSHHPEHYPWRCICCNRSFSAEQAPNAESHAGVDGENHRFCPVCCAHGMIWEAELDYKPTLGIDGMSVLDLLEMLCDWKAAGERHANGSMAKSLVVNQGRFQIGAQLQGILENTAKELGWTDPHPENNPK